MEQSAVSSCMEEPYDCFSRSELNILAVARSFVAFSIPPNAFCRDLTALLQVDAYKRRVRAEDLIDGLARLTKVEE